MIDDECIVFPKPKPKSLENIEENCDLQAALPPMRDLRQIWRDYFSDEVCDPTFDYKCFEIPSEPHVKVTVSDVLSVDVICCQLVDNASVVTDLMFALNVFYDDAEESYTMDKNIIKPGLVCCARFNVDNRWYRSKILEVKNLDKIQICYVDFGTINWECHKSLRLLHKKFMKEPIQCISAKLHNLAPANDQQVWNLDVYSFVFETLHQKIFYASIMEVDYSIPMLSIILTDTSGPKDVNINDLLIEKNMARCSAISNVKSEDNNGTHSQQNETDDTQEKNICNISMSEYAADVVQKLLPLWLTRNSQMDGEGITLLFKEIQGYADLTLDNKNIDRCCAAHFTRSMFLTDTVSISKIWNDVITKNFHFLYRQLFKEVAAIHRVESKYYNLPPYCEKFSLDSFKTLKSKSAQCREMKYPENGYFSEEESTTVLEMKNTKIVGENSKQVGDDDEYRRSMYVKRSSSLSENKISPSLVTKKSSTCSLKNDVGKVVPLKCLQEKTNQVYETDVTKGKSLVLVKLINKMYVVQEQVIRDFLPGTASMLATYRAQTLTDQTENVVINKGSHPGICKTLSQAGVQTQNNEVLTLMPFSYLSTFIEIVSPTNFFWRSVFESVELVEDDDDE